MRSRVPEDDDYDEPAKRPVRSHIGIPYWPAQLDDLGLDYPDVRVYLRICRRAGLRGHCFENIDNMARGCLMSRDRVKEALRLLRDVGLIQAVHPLIPRQPVKYRMPNLEPGEEWDVDVLRKALQRATAARSKRRLKHRTVSHKLKLRCV